MLMIAAPHTTSALICATVCNVIREPRIYKKVIHEISTCTSKGKLSVPIATFTQIRGLPYFTACVEESIRVSPSLPFIIPRRVSAGGLILNGVSIPEGISIGASPSVINRDRSVFGDDADIFRPERWLESSEKVRQMHRFLFTWGFGSRKCAGRHLALLETYKLCFHVCLCV